MTSPISMTSGFTPELRDNQQDLQRDANASQNTLVQYSRSESTVVTIESTTTARPVLASNAVESTSPEQAANNVLQFIAQRLAGLKADGADAETLATALEKAQQGFARGLAEARDVLQVVNRLDDAQQQRLQRVETQFTAGIEAIEQALRGETDFADEVAAVTRNEVDKLEQAAANPADRAAIPEATASAAGAPTPSPANTATAANSRSASEVQVDYAEKQQFKSVEKYGEKIRGEREGREFPARFINSYQSARASFKRQESVELQLRTQDGDIVTLGFNARQSAKFKYNDAGSISYDPKALGNAVFESGSSRAFSKLFGSSALDISVQGNIDDGELAALEELFGQLSEVFSAFFNGDGEAALQQALQLNFNADEIAQFSVDLQLSEKQKVVQSYREIADFGNASQPDSNSKRLNIGDYLQQIRDIAINKVKTVEKTLVEQLLSISFAAGNLDPLDDGDIDEGDDGERSVEVVVADAPIVNRPEDATEILS